jgi:tetratricopeptide (TPR) repeat protein
VPLDERRLAVLEERVEVDLRLGRHAAVVGELRAAVEENPLRERLWALLMRALYGADRQAEALAAYRELRETLVEQLGVDPSPTLRTLHQAMLSGADVPEAFGPDRGEAPAEPAPPPAVAGIRPAQLPAGVAPFVGRTGELDRLDALAAQANGGGATGEAAGPAGPVVVTAIAGTAGVGKTALVLHWAHRARPRFHDGQLYVNLRGFEPSPPMPPIEALAGFLTALGVPAEEVPPEPDHAAALYRTLLADRRMLVVLDNAASADQVRPLLPGSAGCLVLITSRDRLSGLVARDGAQRLTLDVLDEAEAQTLLVGIIGERRAAAEPAATAALARACGRLPLALRIAAANLADQPRRTIAGYVSELTSGDRLADLAIDGDPHTAVGAAFDVSYTALAPPARLLFRRLGLVPGPEVTAEAAATLAATDPRCAARLLDRLAGAHLLDERAPGRFAFHDLLRLYAAARTEREDREAERAGARRRLFDWYLDAADAAARRLHPSILRLPCAAQDPAAPRPDFTTTADAGAWLDAERANLVAAIRHAAEHGPREIAWLLADALRGFFWLRGYTVDWLGATRAALTAAEAEGDAKGQAAAHLSLANVSLSLNRYDDAVDHCRLAASHAERSGWLEGQAAALGNLGLVHWQLGQLEQAAARYVEALAVNRRLDRVAGQATNLNNLGIVYREMGRLELAAEHTAEALALMRRLGSPGNEAACLANLAETCHALGRLDAAAGHLAEALARSDEVGDREGGAECRRILAEVRLDAGRPAEALDLARSAAASLDERGASGESGESGESRYRVDVLNALGAIHERRGEYAPARDHHQRALDLARRLQIRYPVVVALTGLAAAHRGLGRPEAAEAFARQAVAAARSGGFAILEADALTVLAEVQLDHGDATHAVETGERAASIHRGTGHRRGAERTAALLARATVLT